MTNLEKAKEVYNFLKKIKDKYNYDTIIISAYKDFTLTESEARLYDTEYDEESMSVGIEFIDIDKLLNNDKTAFEDIDYLIHDISVVYDAVKLFNDNLKIIEDNMREDYKNIEYLEIRTNFKVIELKYEISKRFKTN